MNNPAATTVAAISTPPGKGGVALIRISGEGAFAVADRVFFPKNKKPFSACAPRVQIYGDVVSEGEAIDDGMATRFPAPHSYTGEDTVEITCHGGVLLTRTVLEAVFAAGAVPAGRGEFTRRAFLNGKLTLTDAEGIGELIDATTAAQIRLSRFSARDKLSGALEAVRKTAVELLASLYARIDYPDEDLGDLTDEEILVSLRKMRADVDALIATYRTGRAITDGISAVICGKPNVGKSSLYNLLAGEDAAIVTDVAGTTRDVLERSVSLGQVRLQLSDTAGLRPTLDPVERLGVARSHERIRQAELIFALFDLSRPLEQDDFDLIEEIRSQSGAAVAVALLNKADLPQAADDAPVRAAFSHVLPCSVQNGGAALRDALTDLIGGLFTDGTLVPGEDAIVSSARQYACLLRVRDSLDRSIGAFESGLAADAASSDLEIAVGEIGEIDGRSVAEEVIADIFSHFCVGK